VTVVGQLADNSVGVAELVVVILRILINDATLRAEAMGGHVCEYPLDVLHEVGMSPDGRVWCLKGVDLSENVGVGGE
jgi:hypothetical protein